MDMYQNYYPNPAQMSQAYNGGFRPQQRRPMMDNRQNYQQNDQNSSKTLWMGNIDSTMDENFIQNAFTHHGINVYNIKIIRNKENGLPLGYGFVSFDDGSTAQNVLQKLNGQKMPNVDDDKRFFLKRANRSGRFSVFVGNLPPQIDNEALRSFFSELYHSVSSAKVIMNDGISKGFGFVSFDDEYDYVNALQAPSILLGTNPISISKARNNQGNKSRLGGQQQQIPRDVRQNYY